MSEREPEDVTARLRREQHGARLSQPESDFVSRWKQLVDKAGGQARVAKLLGWTTLNRVSGLQRRHVAL